jgi:cell division protein FtsQ
VRRVPIDARDVDALSAASVRRTIAAATLLRGLPDARLVITGTRSDDIVSDRAAAVADQKPSTGLRLRHLGAAGPRRQEVHLEDDGALVLSVGKDAVALHLGKGPYRQTSSRRAASSPLAGRHAQASVVFLDNDAHPERVVVRMR